MLHGHSVRFFESQFQRQVSTQEFALNPFETLALDHIRGTVLDLGCGLGNLSLEAARSGHRVVAVDGSPTAVQRIRDEAQRQGLDVQAVEADLGQFTIDGCYDTVVSIGLLMFLSRDQAHALLEQIKRAVAPEGRAIVNVLTEGTTYMDMFDPHNHYLFSTGELERCFQGWDILVSRRDSRPAPGDTRKEFETLVAAKPGALSRS